MAQPRTVYFRIQHIPCGCTKEQLTAAVRQVCDKEERVELEIVGEMVPSCNISNSEQTIVAFFLPKTPKFLQSMVDDDTWMTERQIKIDSSIASIDRNFFGLTQLFKPVDDAKISMDVVAITGLSGNAFSSWKSRNLNVMWLQDFLKDDLPSCRIMTFGYNARLLSNMSYSFEDFCTQFLQALHLSRASEEVMHRPLVLIGHSYGSRVITKSVVRCKVLDDNARYGALLASIKAVVFFGALHRGMETEDIEEYIQEMHQDFDSRKRIMAEIRREDDGVKRELKDFIDCISFFVISIFEKKPSRKLVPQDDGDSRGLMPKSAKWGRTGPEYYPVQEDSAVLNLPLWLEVTIPSESDHSNMAKFSHKDSTYQALLGYLRDIETHSGSFAYPWAHLLNFETRRLPSSKEPKASIGTAVQDGLSERRATIARMSTAWDQVAPSAEKDSIWIPLRKLYFPIETSSGHNRADEGWLQNIVKTFTPSATHNLKLQPRRFGVLEQENRLERVMVEFRPYLMSMRQDPQQYNRYRWRVKRLARILLSAVSHDPAASFPCVPLRCLSENSGSSTPCFLLVYAADGLSGLDEAIEGYGVPPIETRLRLALGYFKSLASLHLAGLVHGNVNTDNLYICFDSNGSEKQPDSKSSDISRITPMLAGFEIARDFGDESYKLDVEDPDLRVYLHPDRLAHGNDKAYQHPVHDVFSLGMTMIEIGLWNRFRAYQKYQEAKTDDDRRSFAIRLTKHFKDDHSDGRMGTKYGAIIAYCLGQNLEPLDKEGLKQDNLYASLFGSPSAARVVEALTQLSLEKL